jgi:hypothetical protein
MGVGKVLDDITESIPGQRGLGTFFTFRNLPNDDAFESLRLVSDSLKGPQEIVELVSLKLRQLDHQLLAGRRQLFGRLSGCRQFLVFQLGIDQERAMEFSYGFHVKSSLFV